MHIVNYQTLTGADILKRFLHTAVSILLIAVFLFTLSACGAKGTRQLYGTWHSITSDSGTSVTFKSSGAVILSVGNFSLSGKYTAENGVIIMNLTDDEGDMYQMTMNYYIDDKKLYLENENGDIETFSK